MNDLETKFMGFDDSVKRLAVWCDRHGVIHQAVGAVVHRDIPRLMWTACGKMDIPANAAWLQRREDDVTCMPCKRLQKR